MSAASGPHASMMRLATGVCGVCLSCSAVASPPMNRGSSPSSITSARSASPTDRPAAHWQYLPGMLLDLRAPRDSTSAVSHQGATALASDPFPFGANHLDLGKSDPAADDRLHSPASRIGELNFRTMSQAEIFARRVHQEGLPIARLFESKSALLSIGLNKKGKPGLWFTHKIH
jgi:hypothetical protein